MATKTITTTPSNTQIVHSNPAESPVNPLSGQPVVAATKIVGNPNGNVSGQVAGTTILVRNPA
jgi:hypothetical protein